MRIIGQNILCCRVKGCPGGEKNKSLLVFVEESRIVEREFDAELVVKMLDWMDWFNLQQVAKQLGETSFPDFLTEEMKADDSFLRRMHRILFEFDIIKGKLVCEDCGRVYPIVDGIPNLIMDDEEI